MEAGQKLTLKELKPEQHFTEPPPRYNEASLVNEPLYRADGYLIELLGLECFEQFTLRFHAVRLGDVHCHAERDFSRKGRIQQPLFPGFLQGD